MEIYDDDEEDRKLSTIQEVSESRDISSPSMFAENCRNRSRKSISSDSDQVIDVSLSLANPNLIFDQTLLKRNVEKRLSRSLFHKS